MEQYRQKKEKDETKEVNCQIHSPKLCVSKSKLYHYFISIVFIIKDRVYYKRPKNGQGQVPSGPGRLDCVPTIIELTRDCLGHRQSTQGLIITEKAEKSKGGNIIPICSILKRSLLICKTIVPNSPLTFSSVQSLSHVRLFATP